MRVQKFAKTSLSLLKWKSPKILLGLVRLMYGLDLVDIELPTFGLKGWTLGRVAAEVGAVGFVMPSFA